MRIFRHLPAPLPTLIRVASQRPQPKELCCRVCSRDIVLEAGLYRCTGCLVAYAKLADLAVREGAAS